MTQAIELQSVTRRFRNDNALEDVTLAVPDGAICGLLGRNGAGKTTVMSLISGQDRPTTGRVLVDGDDPFENEAVLSSISFVRDNQRYPDDYFLHHVLSIAPAFAPHWDGELAAELVEGFRLPRKPAIRKFSRGQLSAVAIVLGLASRAPVTLLDEPYLGLDATARGLFHDLLLRDLGRHPRTLLLSTHLIDESDSLFDHVVLMDRGRVVLRAEAEEARRVAMCVSGVADAVQAFCADYPVLRSHSIGGLRTSTVTGRLDDDARSRAATLGVQLKGASLQDLAVAYGSGDSLQDSSKEGISA
ncbi:ABC transporter ATP-binding protein [Arthrobacter echini]|uniref:ABC transporter ATP-binding protein n=1 Tax=Arthrobacter echini TaxID=1529066 RepID=A0A5D0XUZ7_9MICC|nr:ABC transporter ATP-binding protein [Arthrobacter echini]TYD00564.1 ABC transporter ATP-binding protein [Arthrobacter echini]